MTSNLRRHLSVAAVAAVLLAVDAAPAVARPAPDPSAAQSSAQQLRRDVEALHALGISGVQARAVGPDGRQSVATSGTADLHTGRPVDPDGYFRMASTSKTLIATVVLQLEAEGRLSLDDTVERRLPGVVRLDAEGNGADGSTITVRQLLQHTSHLTDEGLPGYTTEEEYKEQRYAVYSSEELVARAMAHKTTPLEWNYANTNYLLLDMIIQRVTGRPSHQEIEDRILRPLGLDRTRWTGTTRTLPQPHARAYQYYGPASRVDVTRQIPVGYALAWATTTRDENTFLRALVSGRLLPERQLAEMQRTMGVSGNPQAAKIWPKGTGYGLGLVGIPLGCGGTYWSHEGGDGGYITLNGVTADGRRSVVVSMSEARGDSEEHVLEQEHTAGALVEHALCAGVGGPGTS
ncbi:serine hydrolase domain-containing protein [Kitasatospora sp. NPDC097691]|uniref:serine hydrolase domain-containing protein n=1 Tax=Kitasatospora sp. NPDC097691 TaxID=3157231 RepID=UPI00331B15FE